MSKWEVIFKAYKNDTCRMKVDGGWLYRSISYDKVLGDFNTTTSESLAFVPDVDLQRYQSHLRDAYNQGFKEGQDDLKAMQLKTAQMDDPRYAKDDRMKYRPELEGWKS